MLDKSTIVQKFAAFSADSPLGADFLADIKPPFMDSSAHYLLLHGNPQAKLNFLTDASTSAGHRVDPRKKDSLEGENLAKLAVKDWATMHGPNVTKWNVDCVEGAPRLNILDSGKVGAIMFVGRHGFSGKPFITVAVLPRITPVDLTDAANHGAPSWRRCFSPDLLTRYIPDSCDRAHAILASVASFSRGSLPTTVEELEQGAKPVMLTLAHRVAQRVSLGPGATRRGSFKALLLPQFCDPPVGLYWPTDIGYEAFVRTIKGNKPYCAFHSMMTSPSGTPVFKEFFADAKEFYMDMLFQVSNARHLFGALPRPDNLNDPDRARIGTRLDAWQEHRDGFLWSHYIDLSLYGNAIEPYDKQEMQMFLKTAADAWGDLEHPPHPLIRPITAMPFVAHYFMMSKSAFITKWLSLFRDVDRKYEIPTKVRDYRTIDLRRLRFRSEATNESPAQEQVESPADQSLHTPPIHHHNTRNRSQRLAQTQVTQDSDDGEVAVNLQHVAPGGGQRGSQRRSYTQTSDLPADQRDVPTDDDGRSDSGSSSPSSRRQARTHSARVTDDRPGSSRSSSPESRSGSARHRRSRRHSRSRSRSRSRSSSSDGPRRRRPSNSSGDTVVRRGRSPPPSRVRRDAHPLWERSTHWDREQRSPIPGARRRRRSSTSSRSHSPPRQRRRVRETAQVAGDQGRERRSASMSSEQNREDGFNPPHIQRHHLPSLGRRDRPESMDLDRDSPRRRSRSHSPLRSRQVAAPWGAIVADFYSPSRSVHHRQASVDSPRRSPRRRILQDSFLEASVQTRDQCSRCPAMWIQATLTTLYSVNNDRSLRDAYTNARLSSENFAFVREPTSFARKSIFHMFDERSRVKHSEVTNILVRRYNTMPEFQRTTRLVSNQLVGLDLKFYERLFDTNSWQMQSGVAVRRDPFLHVLDFAHLLDPQGYPRDKVPSSGYPFHFAQQMGKLIFALLGLPRLNMHRSGALYDDGFIKSEFGRVLWILCSAPFVNELQPFWTQHQEHVSLLWIHDFVALFKTFALFIQSRQSYGLNGPFTFLTRSDWSNTRLGVSVVDPAIGGHRPDHFLRRLHAFEDEFEKRWARQRYTGNESMWHCQFISPFRSAAKKPSGVSTLDGDGSSDDPKKKPKAKTKDKDGKKESFSTAKKPMFDFIGELKGQPSPQDALRVNAKITKWPQMKAPNAGEEKQICFHCAFVTSDTCHDRKACVGRAKKKGVARGQRLPIDLAESRWRNCEKSLWKPLIDFQNEHWEWLQPSEHMVELVPDGWKLKTS